MLERLLPMSWAKKKTSSGYVVAVSEKVIAGRQPLGLGDVRMVEKMLVEEFRAPAQSLLRV
jgi:hypothetical protein